MLTSFVYSAYVYRICEALSGRSGLDGLRAVISSVWRSLYCCAFFAFLLFTCVVEEETDGEKSIRVRKIWVPGQLECTIAAVQNCASPVVARYVEHSLLMIVT
ncbi:hypothetical protein M405DRAFT_338295 [Rhizopogon salebrosus TDB-379]|nr:hypothetical protein M405DRAFT_338295 [Rhizopogon salebrosus TDB-379]